jgi:uncharacterized protein YkwD
MFHTSTLAARGCAIALFVFAGCLVGFRSVAGEEKKTPPKLELTDEEKALLDLTNKARAAEKLPPLKPNGALFKAARAHSANMAKQDKLEHELDGKRVSDRATAASYDWDEIAENIAVAEDATPKDIVDGWLQSKAHRENLLKPEFVEIGLGVATNAKGEKYYTQVFGVPHKK